jgi:hypothetical protein
MKLLALSVITCSTYAAIQDACQKGSDIECQAYGQNMCCANIKYTFRTGNQQDFYACANRIGIEYTEGRIFDDNGFSGYWYCDEALNLSIGLAASAAIVLAAL